MNYYSQRAYFGPPLNQNCRPMFIPFGFDQQNVWSQRCPRLPPDASNFRHPSQMMES